MEKKQNNKFVDKESNAHCVANIESKWNTKSFSYSTTIWSTCLDPDGMPSNKTSHVPSSGLSDHPRSSPSVAVSMNPIPFPSITPTTFPSDVTSEKPMILVL